MAYYYREDRYGDKLEVEKWTCGSCERYDIDTGRCDARSAYYPKNDNALSCSVPYSEANDVRSY